MKVVVSITSRNRAIFPEVTELGDLSDKVYLLFGLLAFYLVDWSPTSRSLWPTTIWKWNTTFAVQLLSFETVPRERLDGAEQLSPGSTCEFIRSIRKQLMMRLFIFRAPVQLLDLMHSLHTRAAQIYQWWA